MKAGLRGASITITGMVLVLLSGCGENVGDRFRDDDADRTAVDRIEATWRIWARDQLRAGAPGSALDAAEGVLSPNDFGVPPSFGWSLTFRDQPGAADLSATLRRACAFPTTGLGNEVLVTADLTVASASWAVPAQVVATCGEPLRRLLPWLRATVGSGLPAGVRGLRVISITPNDDSQVTAYIQDSPTVSAAARRVMVAFCADTGQSGAVVTVRASDDPDDPADLNEPSRPVGPRSCEDLL